MQSQRPDSDPASATAVAPDVAPVAASAHAGLFRLLGIVLLLLVAGAALYTEMLSSRLADAVSRLQSVREAIEENSVLLGYAVDLESGHRGYLLSGDRRQLESYEAADQALPQQIARLGTLLGHDSQLLEILAAMRGILVSKRDSMRMAQTQFERDGSLTAAGAQGGDLGKFEMDGLRLGARAIQASLERSALQQRQVVHRLSRRQTVAMRITLTFVALIGVVGMVLGARHFQALRRHQQLAAELSRSQSRSDHKSVFLAQLSHEIRTPMNVIFGFSGLLHDRLQDPVNRRHIDAIHSSARSLLALINDLLDLSAIDAGRIPMTQRPCAVRALADGVQSLFAEQAAVKGLRLEVWVSPEVPAVLTVDGERVRQMLVNLVGNAIKYTDHGGVRVRLRAQPGAVAGTASCWFEVQDSGRGIAPEDQARIFEPFARCSSGDGPAGSGLGLGITRRLAHAMGGEVRLRSRPGEGACFTLYLPDLVVAPPPVTATATACVAADELPQRAPSPALAAALRGLSARCRAVRDTLTIGEVRAFAGQISALGREHAVPAVRRYGQNLMAAAAGFDVVRIEALLVGFPALVERIEHAAGGGDVQ